MDEQGLSSGEQQIQQGFKDHTLPARGLQRLCTLHTPANKVHRPDRAGLQAIPPHQAPGEHRGEQIPGAGILPCDPFTGIDARLPALPVKSGRADPPGLRDHPGDHHAARRAI